MIKNKKLWWSVVLTALITFPAGWAFGNGAINKGLVKALASVGQNLFGDGNFGASIVAMDDGAGTLAVQIDVAQPPDPHQPPEPTLPVLLNVFDPAGASCVATAQIAVTPTGVSVYSGDASAVMTHFAPIGAPPNPCRDGNVIGPGGPG